MNTNAPVDGGAACVVEVPQDKDSLRIRHTPLKVQFQGRVRPTIARERRFRLASAVTVRRGEGRTSKLLRDPSVRKREGPSEAETSGQPTG